MEKVESDVVPQRARELAMAKEGVALRRSRGREESMGELVVSKEEGGRRGERRSLSMEMGI